MVQLERQVEVAADQPLGLQVHPVAVVLVLKQQQVQRAVAAAATRLTAAVLMHLSAAIGLVTLWA